jgi:hypothetical protein
MSDKSSDVTNIMVIRSSTVVTAAQGKRKRLRDDLKCTTNISEKTRNQFRFIFVLKIPLAEKVFAVMPLQSILRVHNYIYIFFFPLEGAIYDFHVNV